MASQTPINGEKWLVAAWPGMGNVAVIAAGYLVHKLGMKPAGEIAPKGRFDVQAIEVEKGLAAVPRLPRGRLFRWLAGPNEGELARKELIVYLGEAQPSNNLWSYAHDLIDAASQMGATRVATFASMASQLHPSQDPHVWGVVTRKDLLEQLQKLEVAPLEAGQVSGLNGVLLGAAADRGIPGVCLLGEIPFFAAGVPNPKAAKHVLSAFSLLSGIDVDLEELSHDAETVDQAILELMEKMQHKGGEESGESDVESGTDEAAQAPPTNGKGQPEIDAATSARIEELFAAAMRDRAQAMRLKEELDRLGVFKRYENRFLDLFRHAE